MVIGHITKPLLYRPLMPLLVVLQVALACAIASNTLFLMQQKIGPILAPVGLYDPSHLIVLSHIIAKGPPWPASRLRGLQDNLRAAPDVKLATYAVTFPIIDSTQMSARVYGINPLVNVSASVYLGNNLLDVMGLRLMAGRNFTTDEEYVTYDHMGFKTDGPVIITQALANRLFPDGHALGQLIRYSDSSQGARMVIGVVAHLVRNTPTKDHGSIDYAMLFPGMAARWSVPLFVMRIEPANEVEACKVLVAVVQRDLGPRMLGEDAVKCDTISALRDKVLAQPRAALWLLAGVTLIVLVVTATGIMGMTNYRVQQHTRSIGFRRALGARRSDILSELLIENLLVVGAGVVVGLIASYGVNLWLMRHFELPRLPWIYLPASAVLLLALGQLAVLAPARRASRIPPIAATRAI